MRHPEEPGRRLKLKEFTLMMLSLFSCTSLPLEDEVGSEFLVFMLQEFLKKEFSEENILFWQACEFFSHVPENDNKQVKQLQQVAFLDFLFLFLFFFIPSKHVNDLSVTPSSYHSAPEKSTTASYRAKPPHRSTSTVRLSSPTTSSTPPDPTCSGSSNCRWCEQNTRRRLF